MAVTFTASLPINTKPLTSLGYWSDLMSGGIRNYFGSNDMLIEEEVFLTRDYGRSKTSQERKIAFVSVVTPMGNVFVCLFLLCFAVPASGKTRQWGK